MLIAVLVVASRTLVYAAEPSGAQLYRQFCASCHGADGRGSGPVAPALRKPATDLTTLAERAGGHFDEGEVMAIIDGYRMVATHGPREMPVWGAIFDEELKGQPYAAYTVLLRSKVLAQYLGSIQRHQ